MMRLNDILKEKTKEELKNFARANEIPGYSDLKKEDLITLILAAVIDTDQLKGMFTRLSPSAKWILMIIALDYHGVANLDTIETAVQEQYTRKTFRKAIGMLLDSPFFGLEFNKDDQEIGMIPDDMKVEIMPMVEQYNKRHRNVDDTGSEVIDTNPEELAAEAEEQEEEKEIFFNVPPKLLPIADLLNYIDKKTLKFYCEEHNLLKGGTRQQLIERILNSEPKPYTLIDDVFSTPELQMFANDLDLKKSGTKSEIVHRILENFGIEGGESSKEEKPRQLEKKIQHLDELKTPEGVKTKLNKESISQESSFEKQVDELVYELNRTKFPRPSDERQFQFFILGYLTGKFGDRNVTFESVSQNNKQRLDITLWNKVIIEAKVTSHKKHVDEGLGQLLRYFSQFPQFQIGMMVVYDESPGRNLKSQFFEKQGNMRAIFF